MKPTLIESFDDRDDAIAACRYYASLLTALQLTRSYGVSMKPIRGTSALGIYLWSYGRTEPSRDTRIMLTLASRTHNRSKAHA